MSNAGGAVGFVPPVTAEDIRPDLDHSLAEVGSGRRRLLVGRDDEGRLAATAFLAYNNHRLMTHWIWLYTVMVHPGHQGKGYGRALMAAAEQAAREPARHRGDPAHLPGRHGRRRLLRPLRLQGGRAGARRRSGSRPATTATTCTCC